MTQKIAVIVTSHDRLGNTGKLTGLYLPELAHPYQIFQASGFEIEVASPAGGDAPIDPKSLSDEDANFAQFTQNTLPLREIVVSNYAAFFFVGGHGTMWDFPNHPEIHRILKEADEQQKIIAAVCHGPAALVNAKNADGEFLIKGKKVTGFSNEEEAAVGLTEVMPFALEDALKTAGTKYIVLPKFQPNVVVDGHLVTGQNPASARGVAEAIIQLLTRSIES